MMFSLLATVVFTITAMQYQVPTLMIAQKDGSACANQFNDAIITNVPKAHRAYVALVVASIRYAENGKEGREYGILNKKCPFGYRSQAGWCAATVAKRYNNWYRNGSHGDFIQYLSSSYAPIGADNDPRGLNKNWIKNVSYYVKRQETMRIRLGN